MEIPRAVDNLATGMGKRHQALGVTISTQRQTTCISL